MLSFLRKDVERTSLEAMMRDHDKRLQQTDGFREVTGKGSEEGLGLDASLKKDLLLAEAGDDGAVAEKTLVVMRTLITAAGYTVPVSNKVGMDLICSFATVVHETR